MCVIVNPIAVGSTHSFQGKKESSGTDNLLVRTKEPMQQKNPAKKALKGNDPTKNAYENCMRAVASAQTQNRSKTCIKRNQIKSLSDVSPRQTFPPIYSIKLYCYALVCVIP